MPFSLHSFVLGPAGIVYAAAYEGALAAENALDGAARLVVQHIYGTDLHAIEELLDLGSRDKLADGAAQLRSERPDAVVWACTSGSFVYGWDGAAAQVAEGHHYRLQISPFEGGAAQNLRGRETSVRFPGKEVENLFADVFGG